MAAVIYKASALHMFIRTHGKVGHPQHESILTAARCAMDTGATEVQLSPDEFRALAELSSEVESTVTH